MLLCRGEGAQTHCYSQYKLWSVVNFKSPGCGDPSRGFIDERHVDSLLEFRGDRFPPRDQTQTLYAVRAVTVVSRVDDTLDNLIGWNRPIRFCSSRRLQVKMTYNMTNQSPVVAPLLA